MTGESFIYRNLSVYRLLMNLLYGGNYRKRFDPVCELIHGNSVTELCFGDTLIAEHCSRKGIRWTGFDLNERFVSSAVKKGFSARQADVMQLNIPASDTVIICGSLYHFHQTLELLLTRVLLTSSRIIISEPVINLSSGKGIIGRLAQASANVNGQEQRFRYTERTLLDTLDTLSGKLNFSYSVKGRLRRDIIILITQ